MKTLTRSPPKPEILEQQRNQLDTNFTRARIEQNKARIQKKQDLTIYPQKFFLNHPQLEKE